MNDAYMTPQKEAVQVARDLSSPQKLDYESAANAANAAPAEEPESITTKVLGMIGDIASGLAAGLIPPEMIVTAIEKSEAAIGKAVGMMPGQQKTQFKQVLQRIITIVEQQGGRASRHSKTRKHGRKHGRKTRGGKY